MQPEQATIVLHFLLGSLEHEHATTAKVLAAVPVDRADYTPDPRSMKAMDLAWHIASAEMYFMTGVTAGAFPAGGGRPESVQTPADVVAWYKEQFPIHLAKVKALSGEDLVRIISFHDRFHFPGIAYLQLMLNHSVHHRGQLSAYLRPMGAKVPSIYGSSADEEAARETSA